MSGFSFNKNSKGFENRKPWSFKVDGVTVEWQPRAPFLFPQDAAGVKIIEEIQAELLDVARGWETFNATPTGPMLLSDLSNPHTVVYLVNGLYEQGWVDEAIDEDMVKYSRTAPKLETIFGPQDEGIIY